MSAGFADSLYCFEAGLYCFQSSAQRQGCSAAKSHTSCDRQTGTRLVMETRPLDGNSGAQRLPYPASQ